MTRSKIAVSIPSELHEAARAEVARGRASSVSAVVSDALEAHLRRGSLDEVLAEMDATHGPVDEATLRWADRQLDR